MPVKPKLGQNFLRDPSAVARIVAAPGDLAGRTVVEIGPGAGAITAALASRAEKLIAVELDRELAARLRERFANHPVTIIEGDILEFDFARAAEEAGQQLIVAGNLPYGITSPILLKLAACHASLDRAVLMVQREVADRITAEPGSRDYGLLSVTMQVRGPVERLFTLPPSAFVPPPDVYSSVFLWTFEPRFAQLGVEPDAFLRFVRIAFAQKRKTLVNNMRAAAVPAEKVAAALSEFGLPLQARAESLSLERFATLFHRLADHFSARTPDPE